MALYIANAEAEGLARELAEQTGETITETVIVALRERRDRLRKPSREERYQRLLAISNKIAASLGDEKLDINDLYDEDGLPK